MKRTKPAQGQGCLPTLNYSYTLHTAIYTHGTKYVEQVGTYLRSTNTYHKTSNNLDYNTQQRLNTKHT